MSIPPSLSSCSGSVMRCRKGGVQGGCDIEFLNDLASYQRLPDDKQRMMSPRIADFASIRAEWRVPRVSPYAPCSRNPASARLYVTHHRALSGRHRPWSWCRAVAAATAHPSPRFPRSRGFEPLHRYNSLFQGVS